MIKRLLLICLLFLPVFLNAQEQKEKSESKTVEFLSKCGSFLKKEFYDQITIGSSYYGIDCQILIITDLKSNEKTGCFRLITNISASSNSDKYIGILDPDELDACIMCLEKIEKEIITSTPETYTEVAFISRDGVQIGAYCSGQKNNWIVYVQTKSYTSSSLSTVNKSDLPRFITNLKDAKEMINSKTK